MASVDSFGAKGALEVNGQSYEIFRLAGIEGADTLPYSLKVLLENLLRTEDGANITAEHITKLGTWDQNAAPDTEIQFTPARVIMQDFTVSRVSSTWPPCVRRSQSSAATRPRSTPWRRRSW